MKIAFFVQTYPMNSTEWDTIMREVQVLLQCHTAHVIAYYGAFYHDGEIAMCMEYMDCGSLDFLYRRCLGPTPQPLPEWLLACIARAVCTARPS